MTTLSIKPAVLGGLIVFGALPAASHAVDLLEGADARMLAMTCAGCHGIEGSSVGPAAPTITGMHADYFIDVMEGFASDEIYSTIMGRIARGYTEEEIELMAEYFHDLPFVPAKQEFDAELAEEGRRLHDKYCEKCHAEGGKPLIDEEYYITDGQWTPYLEHAMEDFLEDRRPIERKMKRKLDQMFDREGESSLEALFAFYASQQ
jgi:sulfide dehydrogenase cytochrome subunit